MCLTGYNAPTAMGRPDVGRPLLVGRSEPMPSADKLQLSPGARIHLIGIGGVGMSALAGILAERGFSVSGSDSREGACLDRLRELGVDVTIGQREHGAAEADVVVRSSAIKEDNPELRGARARELPVFHRSDLLAALLEGQRKVAVSGTHGKTTMTAMLATILLGCGRDPTAIVGGDARNLEGNYHLGGEPLAVFEACESDGSFLRYGPCSEIISCIEADHLDVHGDFETVCDVFRRFIALVPADGFLAYGTASDVLADAAQKAAGKRVPFGLNGGAAVSAEAVSAREFGVSFRLLVEGGPGPEVALRVPGEHNVLNALGALSAAREVGVAVEDAAEALSEYRGVARRFELVGRLGEALVVDDYAHHPTEIAATLATARNGWGRRIIAIFQPHLYSRTRDFLQGFASALAEADVIVINEIYGAREEPIEGVSAAQIADAVRALAPGKHVQYVPDRAEIADLVRDLAQPGDLILTLGAGDITEVADELTQQA
jgi:UDP-N-acetylmuramate--alanine ligase